MSTQGEHVDRLEAILREDQDAVRKTNRLYESWRKQAKEFVDGKLQPALATVEETFAKGGQDRSVGITRRYDPIESASAEIVVVRGSEPEFTYRYQLNVTPDGVGINKWVTDYDHESRKNRPGLREEGVIEPAGSTHINELNARGIVRDFLDRYEAHLKDLRA